MSDDNPGQPLPPLEAGEVRGPFWSVKPAGEGYVLEFISGELAGREKSVAITRLEYLGLYDGSLRVEDVLLKYGTG